MDPILRLYEDVLQGGSAEIALPPGLGAIIDQLPARFAPSVLLERIVSSGFAREKAAAMYDGTQPLTSEDIAEAVFWVVSRPAHVNINSVQMMPVCQAFGPLAVKRTK